MSQQDDGTLAVRVRGLAKSYAHVEAVRGIDLDISRGEIFALLGPNGAGKTTTIEILEGYRSRDHGDVTVLGHDPGRQRARLKPLIGIVLQSTGVEPYLTVTETVRMYAGFYPHPRPVDEIIELTGLAAKRGSRVTTLSGGQKRRLDVAVALAGDPELLFLDEPTTGFDPEARREFWRLILSLKEAGTTILLTTHYLDEAQALADRVAIVKDGRVLAIGPPRELRTHPSAHPPGAAHYRVAYRDAGGELVEIQTDDPTLTLNELTSKALARGEQLEELSVGRPTLEDVYLELTADA